MFLILFLLFITALSYLLLRKKNMHIWLFSYLKHNSRSNHKQAAVTSPLHIMFCITDHFEPSWKSAGIELEKERTSAWINGYPKLANKHKDSDGKPPKYTFFYPAECYNDQHIKELKLLCDSGYGEIEVHLHHDADTPDGLKSTLEEFKKKLSALGLLSQDKEGRIRYGFIHGNWALDNSRSDGRWCGVNNELRILKETGCYADFTLPSAPSDTQTKKINSIYYAEDDPRKPKSHNTGLDVEAGRSESGDLMIIQGPLALNWKNRKMWIFPRIENGKLSFGNPPSKDRVDLWIKQNIHVKGNAMYTFVKVYTHGCQEKNMAVLLGKPMDDMFTYLESRYNDGIKYKLHYVTAREMYNIIKAIEDNVCDNPDMSRNYLIGRR